MADKLDIKEEIFALLRAKGCTLVVQSGIVYVTTSTGILWDFTVPTLQSSFLKEGQRVRAKIDVYDLPETPKPGPLHATSGELGTVVHTEPGFWPTVRFDRSGTATCVTHEEVEKVDG